MAQSGTESFDELSARVRDVWTEEVETAISRGKKRILVVAHGNTLRSLVSQLEGLDAEVSDGALQLELLRSVPTCSGVRRPP